MVFVEKWIARFCFFFNWFQVLFFLKLTMLVIVQDFRMYRFVKAQNVNDGKIKSSFMLA